MPTSIHNIRALLATLCLAFPSHTYGVEAIQTLRAAATQAGVFVGSATAVQYLDNSSVPQYKHLANTEFSLTTAENECKVSSLHQRPHLYDFTQCDEIFDTVRAAGKVVRGHNLVWHKQYPLWWNSSLSASELLNLLEQHISTVVGHYGSSAYCWDVVNEAVADHEEDAYNGTAIKKDYDPWMPKVPDFMDQAFHMARKAAPEGVKLFYNDYNANWINEKSDRVYGVVKGMRARGVPIDGIGMQMHIDLSAYDKLGSIRQNVQRFSDLGMEIHMTEIDVRACVANASGLCALNSTIDDEALAKQAEIYGELMQICLDIPNCKSMETWGIADTHTWLWDHNNPTGINAAPLLFHLNYGPKPAYYAILDVLNKHNTNSSRPERSSA